MTERTENLQVNWNRDQQKTTKITEATVQEEHRGHDVIKHGKSFMHEAFRSSVSYCHRQQEQTNRSRC